MRPSPGPLPDRPPVRRPGATASGACAALAIVLGLSSCATPLRVADPAPDAAARDVCGRVMAALPATVLEAKRRQVEPGVLTAAWGDPPITLTCGAELPASMATDTRCFEVNGVGWYAEEGKGGWLFTTIGREVPVQLGVPNRYAPEANALVDVAAAISAHDRELKPCL